VSDAEHEARERAQGSTDALDEIARDGWSVGLARRFLIVSAAVPKKRDPRLQAYAEGFNEGIRRWLTENDPTFKG
jgi:hypothetical protein